MLALSISTIPDVYGGQLNSKEACREGKYLTQVSGVG